MTATRLTVQSVTLDVFHAEVVNPYAEHVVGIEFRAPPFEVLDGVYSSREEESMPLLGLAAFNPERLRVRAHLGRYE